MWVFIDVDLTLIDKDDNPRPHIEALFQVLKTHKCNIVIWSAGGWMNRELTYAEAKVGMMSNKLGIDLKKYVHAFLSKGDPPLMTPKPSFYIDDMDGLIEFQAKEGNGTFKILPYESSLMTNDIQLLKAAEAVSKFIEKQNSSRNGQGFGR